MGEIVSGATGDIWPEKGMTKEELDKSFLVAVEVLISTMVIEEDQNEPWPQIDQLN